MVVEHRELVAAIAAGDADRAEAAMRHHLRMVLSSVPQIQAAHPEYFEES
jgi:DNA-binding GntR family transcriptional regulator